MDAKLIGPWPSWWRLHVWLAINWRMSAVLADGDMCINCTQSSESTMGTYRKYLVHGGYLSPHTTQKGLAWMSCFSCSSTSNNVHPPWLSAEIIIDTYGQKKSHTSTSQESRQHQITSSWFNSILDTTNGNRYFRELEQPCVGQRTWSQKTWYLLPPFMHNISYGDSWRVNVNQTIHVHHDRLYHLLTATSCLGVKVIVTQL